MSLDDGSLPLLTEALARLEAGFASLPDCTHQTDHAVMNEILQEVAVRLQETPPHHHPLYLGQMLKPPHPVARLAYALTMWLNPNNHALDSSPASSQMEKDAVEQLAGMFGWESHLGHLTSGGTFANLESLWIAGQLQPSKTIVASSQAHYTHERISAVLRLPFETIPADESFRIDLQALEARLAQGNVGTVVVTLGTTGVGAVDALPEILELRERYGFRIHVDAAYGGYFTLASGLSRDTRRAFDLLDRVDSLVVDPHKHGLQPYGCGCVLFRDPTVGRFYQHDSPYTYFTSDELHLGEISLECSRSGASAAALWATTRLLPLVRDGEFSHGLDRSLQAARSLAERIADSPSFRLTVPPELDILVFACRGPSATAISASSRRFFEAARQKDLHFALIDLPTEFLRSRWPDVQFDDSTVTCLRSCLMKSEHLDWFDRIWDRLQQVIATISAE